MQKANSFDKASLLKMLKGAGIATGAVAIVYFLEAVSQMDFGDYTPLVVALASIVINIVKEYKAGK